ncbi:MAG: SDR family NAD(P)-dependent oxidoreductase [Alphaproteobacteria bacterium]|jgi:2-hydroxycyclohexanecarboxyl-CoA dehydrogenase|nr:SDR family NAD(P)-dependent oxidoreductase [Alphaproteobacteria bacterium]
MKMDGKFVVVTGGASGIGRATVLTLCEAGAHVFLGDINEEGGAETASMADGKGAGATFLPLDVTDDGSIEAFAKEVHGAAAQVDAVANVAGWDIIEPFIENTPDFWDKVVRINLMGPIKVTRAFLDPMIERNAGKIVSVSSDAGRVGSMGETMYAGTKGGIIAFTKSLAREMARHRINVNCVCPGPTDTPLFAGQPDRMREALTRAIPFRRLAEPEDIANAILFFASDRTDYITGQVLSVSGGLTMVD